MEAQSAPIGKKKINVGPKGQTFRSFVGIYLLGRRGGEGRCWLGSSTSTTFTTLLDGGERERERERQRERERERQREREREREREKASLSVANEAEGFPPPSFFFFFFF